VACAKTRVTIRDRWLALTAARAAAAERDGLMAGFECAEAAACNWSMLETISLATL
jgi:hypothetical protein